MKTLASTFGITVEEGATTENPLLNKLSLGGEPTEDFFERIRYHRRGATIPQRIHS